MTSSSRPSEPGPPGEVDPPRAVEQPPDRARAGAAPVRGLRRWGWFRVTLVVLAGMMALVCLGLVGLGFVLYNEETRPDRSAPTITADSYLRALLVERDEARAAVFRCGDDASLQDIEAFAEGIERRERDLGIDIAVNLEDMQLLNSGEDAAAVLVAVRRTGTVDGSQQSLVDRWTLTLANDDGWRVCSAERMP